MQLFKWHLEMEWYINLSPYYNSQESDTWIIMIRWRTTFSLADLINEWVRQPFLYCLTHMSFICHHSLMNGEFSSIDFSLIQ